MSKIRDIACGAALLALTACSGSLTGAGSGHGVWPPRGEIALGDYANADQDRLTSDFGAQIAGRYPPSVPLPAAMSDLTRNKFVCAQRGQAPGKRGDPPAQICKRTLSAGTCTYTWQVHLFTDRGSTAVNRVRGLYDKTCGEELLGR